MVRFQVLTSPANLAQTLIRDPALQAQSSRAQTPPDSPSRNLEVSMTLQKLDVAVKSRKSTLSLGPDGAPFPTLCRLDDGAMGRLLDFFNLSWQSDSISDQWRISKVILILKEGTSSSEITFYRPIAMLSLIPELLETMGHFGLEWPLESTANYS